MSLTVLSDDQICGLLESLSHDEAQELVDTLRNALHEYSTGTQSIKDGIVHQPERISVHSNTTSATTLFMPSISTLGHAVKGRSTAKTLAILNLSWLTKSQLLLCRHHQRINRQIRHYLLSDLPAR